MWIRWEDVLVLERITLNNFPDFLESSDSTSSIHDVQTHQMYKFRGSYLEIWISHNSICEYSLSHESSYLTNWEMGLFFAECVPSWTLTFVNVHEVWRWERSSLVSTRKTVWIHHIFVLFLNQPQLNLWIRWGYEVVWQRNTLKYFQVS